MQVLKDKKNLLGMVTLWAISAGIYFAGAMEANAGGVKKMEKSKITMTDQRIADPSRLETHVRKLSEQFSPRDHSSIDNLNHAANYIRQQFEQAQGRAEEQVFHVSGGHQSA